MEVSEMEVVMNGEPETSEWSRTRLDEEPNILIDTIKTLVQQIQKLKWSDIQDNDMKRSLCDMSES